MRLQKQEKLSKVDRARIDLWTKRDMLFVVKERGRYPITIPRFTKCHKPCYNHRHKREIARLEEQFRRNDDRENDKVVCIVLEGSERFVWRSDVLTEQEYEAVKEQERAAIAALCEEPRGTVGQG